MINTEKKRNKVRFPVATKVFEKYKMIFYYRVYALLILILLIL